LIEAYTFDSKLVRIATIFAWIIILIGSLVLLGWQFDIEFLKRLAPGLVAMNPVSALCFIASGSTLLNYDLKKNKPSHFPLLLIGVVALCGILKILELTLNWHTGFDTLLFSEKLQIEALKFKANRMAPNTALCFVFSAISLILLHSRKASILKQALAVCVFFIGLLAVLGYIYGVKQLYGLLTFIPMAFHTGCCFMLLSTAILFKEPAEGLLREFTSSYAGGVIERRLFPAAVLVPTILGHLVLLGYGSHWYGLEFSLAILVLGVILFFFALIRFTAILLNRRDASQAEVESTLKKSNDRFFKIFSLSAEPKSITVVETGKLVIINEAFRQLFKLPNLEVAGKTFEDLNLLGQLDRNVLAQSIIKNGGAKNLELQLKNIDGQEKDLLLNTEVVELDGVLCFMSNYFDITERKMIEEKINNLNVRLEQNVLQLEATNKDLESFSYSVSHDLRAPLRRIIQFSEMLKNDLNPENIKMYTKRIVEQAYAMNVLIEDLLSFSNLGNQKVQKKLLDTKTLVEKVVQETRSGINPKAEVVIKELLPMYGDETLIRQVFINLISNALKYSGAVDCPQIEIGSSVDEHEQVYYIKDNGAGFDMKYVHKLFVVFQRLHIASDFEGTGVGLALVQKIVSKHGGRVWAIGEVGKGATFSFSIPIQLVAAV
jgi:PAS domain S-box-containing protein